MTASESNDASVYTGWFQDPWNAAGWRWYDGTGWTGHVHPPAAPATPGPVAVPQPATRGDDAAVLVMPAVAVPQAAQPLRAVQPMPAARPAGGSRLPYFIGGGVALIAILAVLAAFVIVPVLRNLTGDPVKATSPEAPKPAAAPESALPAPAGTRPVSTSQDADAKRVMNMLTWFTTVDGILADFNAQATAMDRLGAKAEAGDLAAVNAGLERSEKALLSLRTRGRRLKPPAGDAQLKQLDRALDGVIGSSLQCVRTLRADLANGTRGSEAACAASEARVSTYNRQLTAAKARAFS